MGRPNWDTEVLWTAYHHAVTESTTTMTAWTIATIATMLAVGLLTTRARTRSYRIGNAVIAVAAIATVSLLGTAKYDAIRTDGYMTRHGKGESARTVQIVCSVIALQMRDGGGTPMSRDEASKYEKACGARPPRPAGIDV